MKSTLLLFLSIFFLFGFISCESEKTVLDQTLAEANEPTIILLRYQVENFESWKKVFQESGELRKENGLRLLNLYVSNKDTNDLSLLFEVMDMEKAFPYMVSKQNMNAMKAAGVTDEGIKEFKLMTHVYYSHPGLPEEIDTQYSIQVRHYIKDFKKWKEKFESFEKIRRSEGIYVTHVFRNQSDSLDVTVLAHPNNLKRLKEYGVLLEDNHIWENAGVIGEPEITLFEVKKL